MVEPVNPHVITVAAKAITLLNLAGISFSGMDLSDIRIKGADLRNAVLDRVNLAGSDLEEVNFSGAWLRSANLDNARLSGTFPVFLSAKSDPLYSVAMSQDAKYVVLAGARKLQLYDISPSQRKLLYQFSSISDESPNCVVISLDNQVVARGCNEMVEVHWIQQRRSRKINPPVRALTFSQIGLVGAELDDVKIWEPADYKLIYRLQVAGSPLGSYEIENCGCHSG